MSKDVIRYALQPILDALAEEEEENNTLNTVNTGRNVFCPNCGAFCNSYSGPADFDYITEVMNCYSCNIEFLVSFELTVNFSSYKIEDNNETV